MKESIMEILLILTLVVLVFTITIPIIDTHKSYKKLKNTRKKLNNQQERKIYELHQLNYEINELIFQEVHKIHPDIDTMRKIVAHKNNLIFPFPNLLTAYELKLITEEKELKLIEATMSPLQLYNSGNPLWTRPFSPAIIQRILEHKNSPNFDKIFQSQLAKCRKD